MRLPALTGILVAIAVGAAARRWLDVVEVRGRSMAPTLLPGDRLLVARLHRAPRAGDVVLARDPGEPRRELIKRVSAADGATVRLRGDNRVVSADASVDPTAVQWHAVLRYWPPDRVAWRLERPPAFDNIDEGGEAACAFPEALIAG